MSVFLKPLIIYVLYNGIFLIHRPSKKKIKKKSYGSLIVKLPIGEKKHKDKNTEIKYQYCLFKSYVLMDYVRIRLLLT